MDGKQINEVELESIKAGQNNDEKDMARLGKQPVLKVRVA